MAREAALSGGSKGEACLDVLRLERREVGQNLCLGHPARKILENVGYGDSSPLNAGLAFRISGVIAM